MHIIVMGSSHALAALPIFFYTEINRPRSGQNLDFLNFLDFFSRTTPTNVRFWVQSKEWVVASSIVYSTMPKFLTLIIILPGEKSIFDFF